MHGEELSLSQTLKYGGTTASPRSMPPLLLNAYPYPHCDGGKNEIISGRVGLTDREGGRERGGRGSGGVFLGVYGELISQLL